MRGTLIRENTNEPVRGREANRERRQQFFALVFGCPSQLRITMINTAAGIHSIRLLGGASSGDRTCSGWEYDMTFKDVFRYKTVEVAVRQSAHGQVAPDSVLLRSL